MRAAEILLNRVWPVPEGRLTPSEAGTMLGLPETHMQAVETARVTRESHASAKLLDL